MKKNTKRFLAKIMTIVMLCSLITFPVNADTRVVLDKQASNLNYTARTADVSLTVKGNPSDGNKADVILVLDRSGSMGGDKMKNLKEAARLFVGNVLNDSGNRVAIVSYSDTAVVNSGFSTNVQTLKGIIGDPNNSNDGLRAKGGTNMHAAMLLAKAMLAKADGNSSKSIVFMSDGEPTFYLNNNEYKVVADGDSKYKLQYKDYNVWGTYKGWTDDIDGSDWDRHTDALGGDGMSCTSDCINKMVSVSMEAKNAGATIFTIGLLQGMNDAQKANAYATLNPAAPNKYTSGYYTTTDATTLTTIYNTISNKVSYVGTGHVVDIVPAWFKVVNGTFKINEAAVTPNAAGSPVTYNSATGEIVWTIGNITKEVAKLSYTVQAQPSYSGALYTNDSAALHVTYNGDSSETLKEFRKPVVLIRPYAVPDLSYTATAGVDLQVSKEQGVLINDGNVFQNDGGEYTFPVPVQDVFSAKIDTQPTKGTVTLNKDGSFSYKPNESDTGYTDTFTYKVQTTATKLNSTTLASDPVDVKIVVTPKLRYSLTVSTAGNGSGNYTVDPQQPSNGYLAGEIVKVTATPTDSSDFAGWTGAVVSSENEITVTMDQAKALTATFNLKQVDLTVTTVGEGTVTKNPLPTNGHYDYGKEVTLTAEAKTGWKFSGWSQDASGTDNPKVVTMNGSKNVTATFVRDQYPLNVTTHGGGTYEVDPKSDDTRYPFEKEVKITAIPNTGWHMATPGWSNNVTVIDSTHATVTMTSAKDVDIYFAIDTHLLTINKTGFGLVTPDVSPNTDGRYDYGKEVELTAVADTGSVFIEWQDNQNASLGTSDKLKVTMDKDVTVRAVFKSLHDLDIDITGNGQVAKNPTPFQGDNYLEGTEVTLTPTPDTGWHFVKFSENVVDNKITMSGPKAVTALFEINQYLLTLNVDGNGAVTPEGASKLYDYNTNVELTATAKTGSHFTGWTGDVTSPNPTISVPMTSAKNVTAHFSLDTHTLQVDITGDGKVTKNPEPTEGVYTYGTTVTLTAVADPNWHFVEWVGADTKDGSTATITINEDETVRAVFAIDTYPLAVNKTGEGTITRNLEPVDGRYNYGTDVILTANAAKGWHFDKWEGSGSFNGNVATVNMTGEKEVRAIFVQDQYALTLIHEHGSVNATTPNGQDGKYLSGTSVNLLATADTGYHFKSWVGATAVENTDGLNQATVMMDDDREVTALFEINTYALDAKKTGEGTIAESIVEGKASEGKYEHGTKVKLVAEAAAGWHFTRWTGDVEATTAEIEVTMTSAKTVTAVFEKTFYPLSITVVGQGAVSVDPQPVDGGYELGTQVSVTATPASGWQFAGWTGDANSSSQNITLTMDTTKVLTATFTQIPVAVTPPSGPTIERDKADPPSTNIPEERAPQGLPAVAAVPAVKPEPIVALPEEMIPLGVPVLPKTGETSSMFFYLLGLGLVGAGVLSLRRKETNE